MNLYYPICVAQDLFSSFFGDQSDSAIDRMGTSLRKTANIPVLKQLNAHAAGKHGSKQSVCLTENDRDILQAMLELNATKINPQTAEHSSRLPFSRGPQESVYAVLKQLRFVNQNLVEVAGVWLTHEGKLRRKEIAGIGATDSPTVCTD